MTKTMNCAYLRVHASNITYEDLPSKHISPLPTNIVFTALYDYDATEAIGTQVEKQIRNYIKYLLGVEPKDFKYAYKPIENTIVSIEEDII